MKTKVEIIYAPDMTTILNQPYFEARVSAGFPSPATDYEEGRLDLNRYLVKNPTATPMEDLQAILRGFDITKTAKA